MELMNEYQNLEIFKTKIYIITAGVVGGGCVTGGKYVLGSSKRICGFG